MPNHVRLKKEQRKLVVSLFAGEWKFKASLFRFPQCSARQLHDGKEYVRRASETCKLCAGHGREAGFRQPFRRISETVKYMSEIPGTVFLRLPAPSPVTSVACTAGNQEGCLRRHFAGRGRAARHQGQPACLSCWKRLQVELRQLPGLPLNTGAGTAGPAISGRIPPGTGHRHVSR